MGLPSTEPWKRIFSAERLEQHESVTLAHLRFCSRCTAAHSVETWAKYAVEGTEDVRCPDCDATGPALTLDALRAFRSRPPFVCSQCGNPYTVPVVPDPSPSVVFPHDEARARELRVRLLDEPWSVPCATCGTNTPPIRPSERDAERSARTKPFTRTGP